MRRRHPRVRRVKLIGPAAPAELGRDLVDPLGHDQDGAVGGLGEEIPQAAARGSAPGDALAVLRDEGKRSVDRQYAGGSAASKARRAVARSADQRCCDPSGIRLTTCAMYLFMGAPAGSGSPGRRREPARCAARSFG